MIGITSAVIAATAEDMPDSRERVRRTILFISVAVLGASLLASGVLGFLWDPPSRGAVIVNTVLLVGAAYCFGMLILEKGRRRLVRRPRVGAEQDANDRRG